MKEELEMFEQQYFANEDVSPPVQDTEATDSRESKVKPVILETQSDEKPDLGPEDDGLKFDGIWEMELGVGD
jgi:hypothetical protein